MRIVIAGAGKLGFSIAQLLAEDQFDVVVVELDAKRKDVIQNTLDVLAIEGNSCSPTTFADPDVSDADVLIACTDSDEVNMVTCLLAKNHGIKHTVARIRNVEYAIHAPEMLNKDMKIDLVINPERITAAEIDHILMTPAALNVDDFAEGRVRMFEAKVKENSPIANIPLKDLNIPKDILMAMVFRRHQMIIPHGNDYVIPGDNVYFVGKREAIRDFENSFSNTYEKLERVLIIGAGRTGRFLAPMLEKQGIQVKVIEKDIERCEALAAQVDKAIVINGDGTDFDLLEAEEVADNDVIIVLTDDDKLNLLVALVGKHMGIPKTVVRVGRPEYIMLMEQVGIDIVFSPRLMTAGQILRFVRSGEGVVSISTFEGGKAESIEILITEQSPVAGKQLKDIRLPGKALVGVILRDDEAIVPRGNTELLVGDHIVLFSLPESVTKLLNYLT